MRFVLCTLLLLLTKVSLSQRYNFVSYSLEEGLPQSQVTDINQDASGYLWIGTETGLSRFNGIEFVNFSTEDGLPDNEIDKIYIDKQNIIWIATPKGLAKYSGDKFEPFLFSKNLDLEYRINDLTYFKNKLYIATDQGILRFDEDTFLLEKSKDDLAENIRAFANKNEEILYCGSKSGFFIFDGDNYSRASISSLDSVNISDLGWYQNQLAISTYGNAVILYDPANQKTEFMTLPLTRIRSMYSNSDVILCATKNGAMEISEGEIFIYDLANGLPFENLRSVFIDKEKNIWLGTDGKGLFKLTGKSILTYTKADGLGSDAVMSIATDSEGWYYFGTYDAGLTKWKYINGKSQSIIINSELKNTTVWNILCEESFECWISSASGIDVMVGDYIIQKDGLSDLKSKIRSVISLNDSIKLIGGADGLLMWDGKNLENLFEETPLDINKIVSDGKLVYLATTTGLYYFDLTKPNEPAAIINLPENNVKTIALDHDNNLWIGTNSSGIFILKNNAQIVSFDLDTDDSRSKTILGIISGSQKDIWVSTLNGVYQIQLEKTADNYSFIINHFGRSEGLVTLECNQNAIFEDEQNFIWVGTSEGLVRIDPNRNDELFSFQKPLLHITGLRLFMDEFNFDNYNSIIDSVTGIPLSIVLPYNKNHLTFDFIGLHLKDPNGVRYQYRLMGAETEWSPLTTNRYATYSFISHGDYEFQVRAINNSGEYSEIQKMQIKILPPFWLTWWFIILVVITILGIIYVVFRIRIKAIQQKQENEQLGFKNRLLFLEQQSLNASMNRHFIFNSLNSIQYFINSSNKLAANKYLTSFAKLIRKNLDSSQANNFIVTLKEELERIELYLSLEKMRFEGKFEYNIDIDEQIDEESIEIPSMILQPFVENSIIHGVLPLERKGHIDLKIYFEFDYLVFELMDDGIGIDNSLASKKSNTGDEGHESMGMEITNRRIDLMRKLTGENLMIIGPFQVNDKDGKSLGTKVLIKIMIEQN